MFVKKLFVKSVGREKYVEADGVNGPLNKCLCSRGAAFQRSFNSGKCPLCPFFITLRLLFICFREFYCQNCEYFW